MKKIIAIALSLVLLCSAASVFADTIPSKGTGDLAAFEVVVENPEEGKAASMDVAEDPAVEDELAKLVEAGSVADYVGEDVAKGITDIVGENGEISVDEFMGVKTAGYEDGMGEITVIGRFATPYGEGEKVAVLIGLFGEDGQVAWSVYEGVGLEDGRVQFTVPVEVFVAMQEGTALLAVCK